MMILPKATILRMQEMIARASHDMIDQDGVRVTVGTIDDRRLRMAAIAAIGIALGEMPWPQDQRIDMPKPVRSHIVEVG
jgi:hypothetical protein